MFAYSTLATAALAGLAAAAPLTEVLHERAAADLTVLQFALTLEHLENVFYKEALGNFTLADFQKNGYSQNFYNNLKYIAHDEEVHVTALTAAIKSLGAKPVAACSYNFKFTDVEDFLTLSSMLEGVGTSAYLGAAPLITDKDYLTTAGSILAVEALHTSMQRLAVGEVPMANPFMTPLDPTAAYTLAASFIVKCPKSNVDLGFTAFPSLTYNGKTATCELPNCGHPNTYIKRDDEDTEAEPTSNFAAGWGEGWGHGWGGPTANTRTPPTEGDSVSFTADANIPAGSYVTFVNGLAVESVKGTIKGKTVTAKIPMDVEGQTYVFVSKSDVEGTFDATKVLFGPAILEVDPAPPTYTKSIL